MASKKGFTLIDLLVTIAIMSLLSAIVMASLAQAKVKAQNAVRQSDFNQLQKALELYFNDKGYYPYDAKSGQVTGTWNSLTTNLFAAKLQPLVDGGYIPRIPIDPLNTTENYYEYRTTSTGTLSTESFDCTITQPTEPYTPAGPYILILKSNKPITGIPYQYTITGPLAGSRISPSFYCVTVRN